MYDPIELYAYHFKNYWDKSLSVVVLKYVITLDLVFVLLNNSFWYATNKDTYCIWFIVYSVLGLVSLIFSSEPIRSTVCQNLLLYFFCSGTIAALLVTTMILIKHFMLYNVICHGFMWLCLCFLFFTPLYKTSKNGIVVVNDDNLNV